MAPVKFDDLSKVAADFLKNDFQTDGFQFSGKQKTSFDGAVVTTCVDLAGEGVRTPAKLTWKLPKPFGIAGLSVDKLEMDKSGKIKMECAADHGIHQVQDLKVEVKSDLVNFDKATAGIAFSGVKDALIKIETKPLNPADFAAEVTFAGLHPAATIGCKLTAATLTAPNLGVRFATGPIFASLLVSDKFSTFTAHAHYEASCEAKLAATYQQGGKGSGNFSVGCSYEVAKGTNIKAKVAQDQVLHVSCKHQLAKGFSLNGGGQYAMQGGAMKYGLQLSIE